MIARRLRWLRIAAIAAAAISLASCRGVPTGALVGAMAVSQAIDAVDSAGSSAPVGAAVEDAVAAAERHRGPSRPEHPFPAGPDTEGPGPSPSRRDGRVERTALEAPCPPLPRVGGCGAWAGPCTTGCPPPAGPPSEPPPPVVGPYLVCDGGDHQRPAIAIGADGLGHLTAGDTVARYTAADEMPDSGCVRLVASSCACVFAPRFGGVREVVRPLEDSRPEGPRGVAADEAVDLEELRQPVRGKVLTVAVESARKGLPGVAVQDGLGPLAVDQGDGPHEDDGVLGPAERVLDAGIELERRRQRPREATCLDVPVAWTRVTAANVLLGERHAEVVAADRGTATLRFEEPGRAELTLCKRAGTDTARPGEELDFTIVMLNSGDRPLTGIVLADAVPTRLEYVKESAAASLSADFTTETGDDGSTVLVWRLRETLAPGGSGFVRFRTIVK